MTTQKQTLLDLAERVSAIQTMPTGYVSLEAEVMTLQRAVEQLQEATAAALRALAALNSN